MIVAQQAIGNFLRATRASQKLTQEQVAAMTKGSPWRLSRAAISAIERGQNFPGMEAMLALSNVLFVDPKELIERARLSTIVPVDITGLSYDELELRGGRHFWKGDYRKALAVWDAMLERLALEPLDDEAENRAKVASLEVLRASALRRAGALLAAMSTVERAISLSAEQPEIQAEAYIVLAGLQLARGHTPLAADAADRAVELARGAQTQIQGWAWVVKGSVLYESGKFEKAKEAYLEARRLARESADERHQTHIEGNIGLCWRAQGQTAEARSWVRRAVELARQQSQPVLEASWLVVLAKIALSEGTYEECDNLAQAALRIGRRLDHHVTIFRAEWMRHLVVQKRAPGNPDRHRMAHLRKLFLLLDQHEGYEEVLEFKKTMMSATGTVKKKSRGRK